GPRTGGRRRRWTRSPGWWPRRRSRPACGRMRCPPGSWTRRCRKPSGPRPRSASRRWSASGASPGTGRSTARRGWPTTSSGCWRTRPPILTWWSCGCPTSPGPDGTRPGYGPTMRTLTPDELAAHTAATAEQGYTVVPDAIEPDLVDELSETLVRREQELGTVPAANDFEGTRTVRIYNLLVHGEVFARVPVHPNVLPVVESVLDDGCLLSSLSSIPIGPDESAQPIHSDDQLIPIPKPHPPVVCNTMWALTDFTEANAPTRRAPATHLGPPPHFGGDS